MSQRIPFEWRCSKNKKETLLCYNCIHMLRGSGNKPKCKCYINMITFYDVKGNKCEKFKEDKNA